MFFKNRFVKRLLAAEGKLLLAKGNHFQASCDLVEAMEQGNKKTFPVRAGHEIILMEGANPLVNIHGFRHLDLNPINGMTFAFRKIDDVNGPVKHFEVKGGYAFELGEDIIPMIDISSEDPTKWRMQDLGQQALPRVHPERPF